MNDPIWVRELSNDELNVANRAKTGDLLPDGSVLLWRDDMNRMGLKGLRRWILERVVDHKSTISVATESSIQFRPLEEFL